MQTTGRLLGIAAVVAALTGGTFAACSANDSTNEFGGGPGGAGGSAGDAAPDGIIFGCNACIASRFQPCDEDGNALPEVECEPQVCAPQLGCRACLPGSTTCQGNVVHECTPDGQIGAVREECDISIGEMCGEGRCGTACELAADQASNVGCEFWAVDLDQQDYCGPLMCNDPASAPWGVVLSNASQWAANVTVELNAAPLGAAPQPVVVHQVTINAGELTALVLPTRELDCGIKPNDYNSPGTCLSSQAFRITSSSPIIVYQFNVFENAFSNDASLLLPTAALGMIYRVINWSAGHPVPMPDFGLQADRSYVTVVGTKPNTQVKVRPSWRIRGNPPIAPTLPGQEIVVTLGPFDVLNLETDDGTMQDAQNTIADLTGTIVEANQPVAVFSGVESTAAPYSIEIPTPPGWTDKDTCCLDHLEEQMFPVESVGSKYVIPRSPIRSTGTFREADVLRFLGVAETAIVKTTLPPPYNEFTLEPGQVVTTWTQDDVIVDATKPVMVGQILVSQGYVEGGFSGDPALTVFPPVDQFRTEYVILAPSSWTKNWVVIVTEVGTDVTLNGSPTDGCIKEPSGVLQGVTYESRRCPLTVGAHKLSGSKPFGIVAYGYGSAGSYAFVGGADVKRIYDPPPLK